MTILLAGDASGRRDNHTAADDCGGQRPGRLGKEDQERGENRLACLWHWRCTARAIRHSVFSLLLGGMSINSRLATAAARHDTTARQDDGCYRLSSAALARAPFPLIPHAGCAAGAPPARNGHARIKTPPAL